MKVNYSVFNETVQLKDIKLGECFKCPRGNHIYMKVFLNRITDRKEISCQYGVALATGGVYPFLNPTEYRVIPIDSEVEISKPY